MRDTLRVRGLQRIGDLDGDRQGFGERESAGGQPLRQGLPFDQLHNQQRSPLTLDQIVHDGNMWMAQRGEQSCFTKEASDAPRVGGQVRGQRLHGDVAFEGGVERAMDLAHRASPNQRAHPVAPRVGESNDAGRGLVGTHGRQSSVLVVPAPGMSTQRSRPPTEMTS